MKINWRFTTISGAYLIAAALPLQLAPLHAAERGSYTYFTAESCASANKMPKDVCSNAFRNAAAEFEEKAPHFPTRAACEQAYRSGACAVSFRSGAGSKRNVSFTPRQNGFRVVVRSDSDITTMPVSPGLNFGSRPATKLAIGIDPRHAGSAVPRPMGEGQAFGFSEPEAGRGGERPSPIPYDPNFDCSKYVEPSAKGDRNSGCLPGPAHR